MTTKPFPVKTIVVLSMVYITILLLSGVMAYKLVSVNNYIVSAAIFVFPISYTIIDITAEVFGYSISRLFIWFGCACVYVFAALGHILIYLHSPIGWSHQNSYEWIIGSYLRLTIAGSVSMLFGEFINTIVIAKWKIVTRGRIFGIRSLGSSATGSAIDTLCEYLIGFTGIAGTHSMLFNMMTFAYLVKLFYAFIMVYPAIVIVRVLKNTTGYDIYDNNTDFTPFSLKVELENQTA